MSSLSLRSILETSKLVGANYDDWYRNLRIVLMHEKLINIIDKPAITAPADTNDAEATKTYQKYLEECLSAKCIMLASMSPELQRQHEDMEPPAIIEHLKKMYGGQSRTARYQLSKALFRSSLAVNAQVGPHVLKMIDLIEQLEKLGCTLGKELSQDLILQSLPDSFSQFIVNFNMNKMSCDLHEMLNLLIDYENQVSSEKNKGIIMVVGKTSKKKGKGKYIRKRKPLGTKGGVTKPKYKKVKTDHSDAECFFCKEKGHWKRNCKKYLDSLKNKKQVMHVSSSLKRKRDSQLNKTYLWHCRLGHVGEKRINKLYKEGYLDNYDYESYKTCESCLKGKMTKSPFIGTGERASELLGLVHTDVCGPMKIQAKGGYSYFITFTDDMSRYGFLYLMKHKSESFEMFKRFRSEVEKQTGNSIKVLRSDRGGEYLSENFIDYLRENGILSQWTPPGTPQHNGVSERRNRTLLDMVRSMMGFTDLPVNLWGYALEAAAYLLNKIPTKTVSTTPYEIWKGRKPNLKHIKVWGCPAYVKKLQTDKLEARSDKCRFIGYPKETMGYYFYHPLDHKVFVARGGTFLEREFLAEGSHGKEIELDETQEETNETTAAQEHEMEFEQPFFDVLKSTQRLQSPTIVAPKPAIVQEQVNEPEPAVVQEQVNEPILEQIQQPLNPIHEPLRRSSRAHRAPNRLNLMVQDDLSNEVHHNDDDPKNYEEAMQSLDRNKWQEAMESEIESMKINKVWTLVEASKDIKPIGCKWVYKKKIGADGKVETYKARLVAKGYRQKEGIDYDETFSPVAMLKSIRILLAIAAYYDYEIWQMDVKTAFLNGKLKEDVYMTQPEGYTSMSDHKKVCKLQRSIYGLKQASRSWNIHFNKTIEKFDFVKCEEEPCVYKRFSGSTIIFLVLYVDDILLIGNDIPAMQGTKVWLSEQFSMKDLGEAAYILGIKIYRDRSKRLLGLSQSMYIDTILKRYNMENSKRGYLPIGTGVTLSREDCPKTPEERERMNRVPYASAVGAIMYTMTCTRPDVAYALSVASRYQANPGEEHWKVVKTILKYLRRTKDQFLIYGESELKLKGYTDASFASDKDDSKSISGYVFTLNGGAVSWKSSKQATVADSTTEAEYIAASEAAKEAVWMKKFISELGVVPSIEEPIPLLCDNNGAIAQAKEPRSHQKSKHVLRRYHLIREIIERGDVKIEKIDGKENAADPFTKALGITQFDKHKWEVGMKYMTDWL
ncbi:Retrovirus-related Pol polyprotein from transposon TNT 1-94 [Vitis vinifera]|uniref:Retrovirus-related Pol polyprotein from transposon TNT 1-94 n=1 Tax=Vitis vinifera TaxID=29760 RepID=A0A438G7B8_VITVI|nr:Retrovirus-related Pol polyprotein from transposon TNT 1-94 [Vitis vinifera]